MSAPPSLPTPVLILLVGLAGAAIGAVIGALIPAVVLRWLDALNDARNRR